MAKMLITEQQYLHLNPMAKELHDYWMNFKPKMYKEMAAKGNLYELIKSEGDLINEVVIDNLQNLGIAGAKELGRSMIYDEMSDQ